MAGTSMKDIRARVKSMESTRQITRAMETVASSKLRRARERAAASRPYFRTLYQAMRDIVKADPGLTSPYVGGTPGERPCIVVIAGDRGLAGGYNSNVLKLALTELEGKGGAALPMGRKAEEFFRSRGIPLAGPRYLSAEGVGAEDCAALAQSLCRKFLAGEFDRVVLCYTQFVTALTQTPAALPLLPLGGMEGREPGRRGLTVYEPDGERVFHALVPEYVGGVLWGALRQSLCSEQAARRAAMDSATRNADGMIGDLRLRYNRARQGAITQELTEIVAGAER